MPRTVDFFAKERNKQIKTKQKKQKVAIVLRASKEQFKLIATLLFQFMEWDAQNVILTGSSDGVVRVSSPF